MLASSYPLTFVAILASGLIWTVHRCLLSSRWVRIKPGR